MEATKYTRLIIIIGCIITFIIVPAAAYFTFAPKNTGSMQNIPAKDLPNRSQSDISTAITNKMPELMDSDSKPTFTITKVERLEKVWYVVFLRTNDDVSNSNPFKALLYDNGSKEGLSVLLGPGTAFPENESQQIGVPSSIAKELNK